MVRFFVVTDQTSPAAAFFSACSITSPYDAASAALPPACSSARAASRSPSRCSGSGGLAEMASEAEPSSSHRAAIGSTCCTGTGTTPYCCPSGDEFICHRDQDRSSALLTISRLRLITGSEEVRSGTGRGSGARAAGARDVQPRRHRPQPEHQARAGQEGPARQHRSGQGCGRRRWRCTTRTPCAAPAADTSDGKLSEANLFVDTTAAR